jgi:hypothetical protein
MNAKWWGWRYRVGDSTALPLESCGCQRDAWGSVMVSAMREAVELGSMVTTEEGEVPIDLPLGSKSSNSLRSMSHATHGAGAEGMRAHCKLEGSVGGVGGGGLKQEVCGGNWRSACPRYLPGDNCRDVQRAHGEEWARGGDNGKSDVTINAAAVIPPAVGLRGICFDNKYIVTRQQELRRDDVCLRSVA